MTAAEVIRDELQIDIADAEKEAFKAFVKKHGLKTVKEYEQSQSNEFARKFGEKKNELTARA